jgi:nucleotide-binding universal stress UspA family protein
MFKTVLWATDGSKAAERALAAAESIAQTYGARLIITHVPVPVILGGPTHVVKAAQQAADAIEANLQRKVEDLKRDGVTAEFASLEMTTHGTAHTIADFSREAAADLIVVGTSGTSRLVRVLVGSVTQRLLELAPCPVLAVPPEDEDIKS